MLPTSPALSEVLATMFAASAEQGAGVHQRLSSGLHVKVGVQGARRMMIVWRDGDRLPGGKECEILGEDAGFYAPKYRSWTCKESDSAFLITDSFRGEVCRHTWGLSVHFDGAKEFGYASSCQTCGATWMHTSSRRGKKESWHYNGQTVRETVFHRRLVEGPVPAVAQPQPAPPAPVRPAPLPQTREQRAEALKARQEAQERALAQHLRGLLTCVAFRSACRSPWFARHQALEARRSFLKGATLAQLREECGGRWFASHFPRAVPYVLLACRWQQQARALPLKATPERKVKAPRKRRTKAVAA